MNSKDILKILKQINENETYKKVFINGAWGIGKTHYVNKYKIDKDNVVYISLFGKVSFDSIEDEISSQLISKLKTVGRFSKNAKKVLKNITGSITLKGISLNSSTIKRKSIIVEFEKILKTKPLLIIIDDIERKSDKILIQDIMGLLEEFSSYENIRLVIIGDETNIPDKEKWKKFKEKIIEKEYLIVDFSDEAINNIVKSKIEKYIDSKDVDEYIDEFIYKHGVTNLRTIIKSINLFKEIHDYYLNKKSDKSVNLMLLKNCTAVVIESTEEKYKPKEDCKNDVYYNNNATLPLRIINNYFKSPYIDLDETCILKYVISIHECNFNGDTIEGLNRAINSYLKMDSDEKDIFYYSSSDIKKQIIKLYKNMDNNKYKYTSLEQTIEDFHDICVWNNVLNLNISLNSLLENFCNILFNNYYNFKKSIYNNKIDNFGMIYDNNKELLYLVNEYNNKVINNYLNDKFNAIIDSINSKSFDKKVLEWLESGLSLDYKEIVLNDFIIFCRNNKYLMPDISEEISENSWSWIHYLWRIINNRTNEEFKKEFNDYVNTLKINELSKFRIETLQKYRPLVIIQNDSNEINGVCTNE